MGKHFRIEAGKIVRHNGVVVGDLEYDKVWKKHRLKVRQGMTLDKLDLQFIAKEMNRLE